MSAQYSSTETQVQVIELFTSEGCSSCPPADNWITQFTRNPDLWNRFIPVAFHVDYWNYLGWPDRFASEKNTWRQYNYKHSGNISSVYTPGFVVDGNEWRRWFSNRRLPAITKSPGVLSVIIDKQQLSAEYRPRQASAEALMLNIVLLGFNIERKINGGENTGKTLIHNFVVLEHIQIASSKNSWMTALPTTKNPVATGFAAWVSTIDNQAPIQATGGWLPDRK